MALIKCPECDRDISELAANCPHCGYPIPLSPTSSAHSRAPILAWQQKVGLAGAALTCLGVFLPIVSVPMLGALNAFGNGRGLGRTLLALALVSGILSWRRYCDAAAIVGAAAGVILGYYSIQFQRGLTLLASSGEGSGNLIGPIAEGVSSLVQIQWGFAVLVVGAVLMTSAATPIARLLGKFIPPRPPQAERVTIWASILTVLLLCAAAPRVYLKAARENEERNRVTAEREMLSALRTVVRRQFEVRETFGGFALDSTPLNLLRVTLEPGISYWTEPVASGYLVRAYTTHSRLPGRYCGVAVVGPVIPPFNLHAAPGSLNNPVCEAVPASGLHVGRLP